jgi:predicted Zn finger-like uncharacterized protein
MDVRCEKCRTEYELDESKLKPGGVTVKCTHCGHMFKVRRRITAVGPAVIGPPTLRQGGPPPSAPRAPKGSSDPPPPRPVPGSIDEEHERTWLIRLEDGEILTCRELATLQTWIVAGRVARACEISRTGKKWKPLGDIGELASFFEIADEARQIAGGPVMARAPTAHPRTVPRQSSEGVPVPASQARSGPVAAAERIAPPPPARLTPEPVMDPDPPTALWEGPAARRPEPGPGPSMRSGPGMAGGDLGPMQGVARSGGSTDAAFAGRLGDRKGEFENGAFVPTDDYDAGFAPPSSSGRWIAAISLVIILAGAIAIFFILSGDGDDSETTVPATPDAAPAVAAADAAPAPVEAGDVLAEVDAAVAADDRARIEAALEKLEALPEAAAAELPALVARARLETALAQQLLDEAESAASSSERRRLVADARARAGRIEKLSIRAEEIDGANAAVMVARAESLRIRARPAREAERWIRRALETDAENREALLARAQLYIRDRRPRDARKILEALPPVAGDVRTAYRLARLDVAEDRHESARERIDQVLASQADHAGARRLAATVDEALATGDSGEDARSGSDDGGDSSGDGADSGGGSIDSYDRLLDRADKLAERGRCDAAKTVYEKALEVNPAGVAALTGLGYCYLDSQQFASAHSRFRAALGISSRYQSALWGMGELYERQGLKRQAIAAFEKFIEAHPSSPRASTARERIARLGGGEGGGEGGDGSGPGGDGAEDETGDAPEEGVEPVGSGDEGTEPDPAP